MVWDWLSFEDLEKKDQWLDLLIMEVFVEQNRLHQERQPRKMKKQHPAWWVDHLYTWAEWTSQSHCLERPDYVLDNFSMTVKLQVF